jgi:CDP-glucose 4,6-dehydratase
MDKRFWRNKNVLITGYEGFLGSHLTKALIAGGARVAGVDILTHRKETILSAGDLRMIKVYQGSVADFAFMKKVMTNDNIEIIFHLAAKALVNDCLKSPRECFSANIEGTWNILEAARGTPGVKALVVASSDKAYGSHKKLPYKENAPLAGNHPYDVSKSCADLIAGAYYNTYGVPAAVTRCGNIYGPGDFNFSRVVPDAVRCAILGKTFNIRSDGKFTRDYIYVDDIVEGYLLLGQQLRIKRLAGEAFNFSDENPLTVIDLVKTIYRACGTVPAYKILGKARYEIKHQYLSSGKARNVLKWEPRYSLNDGLKRTIEWYGKYLKVSGF